MSQWYILSTNGNMYRSRDFPTNQVIKVTCIYFQHIFTCSSLQCFIFSWNTCQRERLWTFLETLPSQCYKLVHDVIHNHYFYDQNMYRYVPVIAGARSHSASVRFGCSFLASRRRCRSRLTKQVWTQQILLSCIFDRP